MLKKAISIFVGPEKSNQIYQDQEDFTKLLGDNFKIVLYCSFNTIEDFIGLDILINLIKVCKLINLEWIKVFIRISNDEKQIFSMDNIEILNQRFDKVISNIDKSNLEKILICGPQKMCFNVFKSLKREFILDDKILII